MVFLVLHGKVICDVDPTSGIAFAAKLDPVNFGGGLMKLVSYNSGDSIGPFVHLNTNVKDLITGNVPQNPQTPEWAGMTSGDPKLDNSTFALTAKFQFLALELDVFGLLDKESLVLMTYMGLNENLPGLSVSVSRQMNISINKTMFSAGASFKFDIEFDIPSISIDGFKLGSFPHQKISLSIGMLLQINYDTDGWMNDGLVYEASFDIDILGLDLDIPHMEIDITVKDLKNIPDVIENFIRDKVIDFLKDKIVGAAEEAFKEVEKIGSEVVDVMTHEFNVAEQDVAHAFTEVGQDVEHTALTLKHDLGMGSALLHSLLCIHTDIFLLRLDDAVGVFMGLGHDISHFGEGLANAFGVSKAAVVGVAVLKGACSVEHAMAAGLGQGIHDIKNLKGGLASFATDLANITGKALDELEDKAKEAEKDIEDGAKKGLKDIEDKGKEIGKGIEDKGKEIGKGIEDKGKEIRKGIEDKGKEIGKDIEKTGKRIAHGAEHVFNAVKSACTVM